MAGRETGWPVAYECEDKKLSPACAAAVAATQCGTGGQRPAQCVLCLKNKTAAVTAAGCEDLTDDSISYFCDGGSLCEATTVQRLRHNYAAKIERLDVLLGGYLKAIADRGEAATTLTCLGERKSAAHFPLRFLCRIHELIHGSCCSLGPRRNACRPGHNSQE